LEFGVDIIFWTDLRLGFGEKCKKFIKVWKKDAEVDEEVTGEFWGSFGKYGLGSFWVG